MEEDKEVILRQTDTLEALRAEIEKEEAIDKEVREQLTDAKRINKKEEEINRLTLQDHAALRAKFAFIDKDYDYESSANAMSTEMFSKIRVSNDDVNTTMETFLEKIAAVQ